MSPRILIAVVIALVAGLLLGRMGPQIDLRRARERIKELESEQAARARSGGAPLSGVKSMLKVSQADMEAGAKARRKREEDAKQQGTVGTNGPTSADSGSDTNATERAARDRAAMTNQIETMKRAWSLRVDIARTNFIAKTKLDEKGRADFDVLVEAMNLRLGTAIDKWATVIREKNEMTPELGVRMMTDLGNAVVLTYDEFDRVLPPTWRENAGKFEMVDFIDPEVLTPLQDLEGVINQSQNERGRRRGPFGGPTR